MAHSRKQVQHILPIVRGTLGHRAHRGGISCRRCDTGEDCGSNELATLHSAPKGAMVSTTTGIWKEAAMSALGQQRDWLGLCGLGYADGEVLPPPPCPRPAAPRRPRARRAMRRRLQRF